MPYQLSSAIVGRASVSRRMHWCGQTTAGSRCFPEYRRLYNFTVFANFGNRHATVFIDDLAGNPRRMISEEPALSDSPECDWRALAGIKRTDVVHASLSQYRLEMCFTATRPIEP